LKGTAQMFLNYGFYDPRHVDPCLSCPFHNSNNVFFSVGAADPTEDKTIPREYVQEMPMHFPITNYDKKHPTWRLKGEV